MTNSEVTKVWIKNFQEYCKNKPEIFEYVLDLAIEGKIEEGRKYLQNNLPFKPHKIKDPNIFYGSWPKLVSINKSVSENKNELNKNKRISIFNRDFYQCRYSGIKLLSLEAIELIKTLYPIEFPFPSYNGNYLISHIETWSLYPQVDHIIPLKSQKNEFINTPDNLATVASTLNMIFKNKNSINDMGVNLIPISNLDSIWDGLKSKSIKFMNENENLFQSLKVEAQIYYNERLAWAKTQK